jgi:hypothetical protein
MNQTKATIDHDEIKHWAEARNATPARVKGTGGRGDVGMIRLDFPGYSGADSLEAISWDEFFAKFDEGQLALVYRESLARGGKSNFNKLVGRETVDISAHSGRRTALPRRRAKQQARAGASTRSAAKKRSPSKRTRETGAATPRRRAASATAGTRTRSARKASPKRASAGARPSKRGQSQTSRGRARKTVARGRSRA